MSARRCASWAQETYTAASASDPTPIVEIAAELWDEVCWVLGVGGFDQMVIVGGSNSLVS